MPRDVRTRWNSTYDMLSFSLQYRKAIEHVTSDLKNDLRKYELTDTEWIIASELTKTLQVTCCFQSHSHTTIPIPRFGSFLTCSSRGWVPTGLPVLLPKLKAMLDEEWMIRRNKSCVMHVTSHLGTRTSSPNLCIPAPLLMLMRPIPSGHFTFLTYHSLSPCAPFPQP
ncbi:uncharacterized protein LACBIDRAFT_310333 [Laccaria bicolor S238N-H82]|uniref:Predicted protein n=1 Tax=Laccaria bicolor (strain S238N-H82 / ATCC MYA-4686) TaxID=486041 RepID=B0DU47_LACBS|nr:uncharacterized protein LACBIDRAFT_310333 [Laccaria bicolor S238N-H82]EDR01885.1 predicted protein [Laccaria bicolor S238N-H82]|eukprot:XP_001887495.1 predicted protein [Laccaria bicolor S238N-H82]